MLASLGPPYVYNYDVTNETSLIAAAEQASRLRFASFVPAGHTLEAASAAACASLIQHDGLCACANAMPTRRETRLRAVKCEL